MSPRRRQRDLPLARDASARFLPWLIAFMVYLAALALVAGLAMRKVALRWDGALAGRLTVQLPPPGAGDTRTRQERIQAAIAIVAAGRGVVDVEVLERAETARLLEPWLGAAAGIDDLPLPDLLAITLSADAPDRLPELASRLAAEIPGATLDDHQRWLGNLLHLATSIELLAYFVVVLVGLSAVTSVVFVTRTGLAIHRKVIELLHLMGAQDRYVARQFQVHALGLGLRGGAAGLVLALATFFALQQFLGRTPSALLPELSLGAGDWLMLALLPLGAALVAMLTARWTVLRTLARLP